MRVLVVSTRGVGHIYPLVPLAQSLEAAGHEVLWAVPPDAIATIEAIGMRAVGVGLDRAALSARANELAPGYLDRFVAAPPRQREVLAFPVQFAGAQGPAMLRDLNPLVSQWAPAVIVLEPAAVAAPPLAVGCGLPHVVVGFGGFPTRTKMTAAEPQLRRLWAAQGLEVHPWGGLYDHLYLHPFPSSVGDDPPAGTVRPMRPMCFDGAPDAEALPAWVDRLGVDRPCVYVTFGTEIARFAPIDVVVSALADVDMDAVVTTAGHVEATALARCPANVHVADYLPQRAILPRASMVVSHAGSGTVLGAATRGLAQLCLPVAADQFSNGDAVAAAGLGICLDPEDVTETSVADALHRLATDAAFGERARAVAAEFADMPEPAALVPVIESLV